MDLDDVMLKWSQTVYVIGHALYVAKSIKFGNLDTLIESLKAADTWNDSVLGFESALPVRQFTEDSIRLDGSSHEEVFKRVAENIVKILFINLAVIADDCIGCLIKEAGVREPLDYLQNKVEWAKKRLDQAHHWAADGLFELVAIRNAIVHNGGRWNDKSVSILKLAGITEVDREVEISLSYGDLFRYRRALRTLLGELRKLPEALVSKS